jgi:hypothetical protein
VAVGIDQSEDNRLICEAPSLVQRRTSLKRGLFLTQSEPAREGGRMLGIENQRAK